MEKLSDAYVKELRSYLSEYSCEVFDLNEDIVLCVRSLASPDLTEFDKIENEEWLQAMEEKVLKWLDFNTDYLSTEQKDKWAFELDKKVLEIMLLNIRERKELEVVSFLFSKHRIHIKCLPVGQGPDFGRKFYCPVCEKWHIHSDCDGHRIAHCDPKGIYRVGEEMQRENPLRKFGYVLEMLDDEDLREIRDSINAYLKHSNA